MTINFRDPQFIAQHIEQLTAFYQQHAIDPKGGFFQTLLPSGEHQQRSANSSLHHLSESQASTRANQATGQLNPFNVGVCDVRRSI